jgi:hypothetical protein
MASSMESVCLWCYDIIQLVVDVQLQPTINPGVIFGYLLKLRSVVMVGFVV